MLNRIPWDQSGLLVVFDYETCGLHVDNPGGAYPSALGLKWGESTEEQVCIPVDQGVLNKPGTQPTLFGDAPNVSAADWDRVHHWMCRQQLVAHNAKADLWFAAAGLRTAPHLAYDLSGAFAWDTMVAESLLDPGERVAIHLVARRRGFNSPVWEQADERMRAWVKKHKIEGDVRYDTAPWDVLEPYLSADLERTWQLYHLQQQQVEQGDIGWDLLAREFDLVKCLFGMERRGLPYRREESYEAAARAVEEMAQLEASMPFDPHSRLSVRAHLEKYGLHLEKTDKGNPKVDQSATARAVEQLIPGAKEFQRWTKLQTASSLWYKGWADKAGTDNRIRADYRQVKTWDGNRSSGTVSGRFAVSRVQVQAIPNKYQIPEGYPAMQDLIKAESPNVLWETDLSQAEMRVVAVLSGCTAMLEGFANGLDSHDATTQLIWGIDKSDPDWNRYRQIAKRLGFGVIYGAGIGTLADQIRIFTGEDLGIDGVKSLWERYRRSFPELFRYNQSMQRQVKRQGFLVLPGGKIRKWHPTEFEHKALNAMIQGAVAVGMVEAMLAVDREYPGVLVGNVHDSVLFETADPDIPRGVSDLVSGTFERWFPGCPFPTDLHRMDEK